MSFNHLNNEAPGKRFLFVQLEQPERYSTDWRHICATVVREAVSHIPPNETKTWWDYYDEQNAQGYRCSSWSARSPKAVYVEDLQLRGQIDVNRSEPLNNGRPYANKVEFRTHSVDANNARAMNDFFTKMHKFYDKHNYRIESDSFLGSLYALSEFLGIKTFLFYAPGITSSSFDQKDNFIECNFAEATEQINKMLAPFSRD
jgi:hypothetical protein